MITYEIRNTSTDIVTIPIADGDKQSNVTIKPNDTYWITQENWDQLPSTYRSNLTIITTRGSSSSSSYDGTSTYDKLIDDASSTISYFGEALAGSLTSGAVWRIYRWEESGTSSYKRFADGSTNFDKIWDNRATYDYVP